MLPALRGLGLVLQRGAVLAHDAVAVVLQRHEPVRLAVAGILEDLVLHALHLDALGRL
jgi:hypothetical protein